MKRIKQFLTNDRAVSPVVGVALLIAITVILAAVIGGVVLGLGTSSADAPQTSLQFEVDEDEDELLVTHTGGEALDLDHVEVRGVDGDFTEDTLGAGETDAVTLDDGEEGEEVAIVWVDPNSNDEAVIGTHKIDDDADLDD